MPPNILTLYDAFQSMEKAVEQKLYEEMLGALKPNAKLPEYRKHLIASNIGGNLRRLPRSPETLRSWVLVQRQNLDSEALTALDERIARFTMLQGSLPYQPDHWLEVFTGEVNTSSNELLIKLNEVKAALNSGNWLNFDLPIMRDKQLPVYAIMLFTLNEIDLKAYTDLSRIAKIIDEYPSFYQQVAILTDSGEMDPLVEDNFEDFLIGKNNLKRDPQVLKEAKENFRILVKTLPKSGRNLVRIACPDYTERPIEDRLNKESGFPKLYADGYYYFIPISVFNLIQFSLFKNNFRPMFPIQGSMPAYPFIHLQMNKLKPASVLHRNPHVTLWPHDSTSSATGLTDHDMYAHVHFMSKYSENFLEDLFSLTRWLETHNFFSAQKIPDWLNTLSDLSGMPSMNIVEMFSIIPMTALFLMFLSDQDDAINQNEFYLEFKKSEKHMEIKSLYEKLFSERLVNSTQSLMKRAVIINFYLNIKEVVEKVKIGTVVPFHLGGNLSDGVIPETIDELISTYKDMLLSLSFNYDSGAQVYTVYQINAEKKSSDSIVSQSYDDVNDDYPDSLLSVSLFNLIKNSCNKKGVKFERLPDHYNAERSAYVDKVNSSARMGFDSQISYMIDHIISGSPSLRYLLFFNWISEYPSVMYTMFGNCQMQYKSLFLKVLYELNPGCIDAMAKMASLELTSAFDKELVKCPSNPSASEIASYNWSSSIPFLVLSCFLCGSQEFNHLIQNTTLRKVMLNWLTSSGLSQEIKHTLISRIIDSFGIEPDFLTTFDSLQHAGVYMVMQAASKNINLPGKVIIKLLAYWLSGGEKNDSDDFTESLNKLVFKILNDTSELSYSTWSEYTSKSLVKDLMFGIFSGSSDATKELRYQWQNTNNLQKVLAYLVQHSNNKTAFFQSCLECLDLLFISKLPLLIGREFFRFIATSPEMQEQLKNNELLVRMNSIYTAYADLIKSNGLTSSEMQSYKKWMGIPETLPPTPVHEHTHSYLPT